MSQVNQYVEVPQETNYKLVPPDGGWGYFVVLAFIVYSVIVNIPNSAFGLLYGDFLASIGDETTATALTTGLFFTAQSFSGFVTDILLRKYNPRIVGFMGAFLYFLGAFGQIFVHSLPHMIICFSAMQGLACGLLVAAIISSFNSYFTKKMNLMMGIAQSVSILSVMLSPFLVETMTKLLGFRNSLSVLAGLSLLIFVGVGILDPVDKHMRKVYEDSTEDLNEERNGARDEDASTISIIPIIQEQADTKNMGVIEAKMRASISNLGVRTLSSMTLNKDERSRRGFLDYSLLKDWKFLAVNIGLSTSFCSDVSFIALIPVLLGDIKFSTDEIAFMMTVFFACDLGARILYSIISAFYRIKSRYVYLAGTVLSAIARILFDQCNSYIWRLSTLATLGFLRCFIQTTLMLVITEEYKDNFAPSFSISMILCGIINLTFGMLGSFLKYMTGSSIYVLHLLTVAYICCIVLWTIEMLHTKFRTNRKPLSIL